MPSLQLSHGALLSNQTVYPGTFSLDFPMKHFFLSFKVLVVVNKVSMKTKIVALGGRSHLLSGFFNNQLHPLHSFSCQVAPVC